MQGFPQVPSIAMMVAGCPRSNTTLLYLGASMSIFTATFSRYRERTALDEGLEGSGPGAFHCPALEPLLLDVLSERLVAEEPSRAAALIIIGARRQDRCLRPTLLFALLRRDPRSFSPRFALGHFVAAVAPLRCCSAVFG